MGLSRQIKFIDGGKGEGRGGEEEWKEVGTEEEGRKKAKTVRNYHEFETDELKEEYTERRNRRQ